MTISGIRSCMLVAAFASSWPVVAGQVWSTEQGDHRHSGYVPVNLDSSKFRGAWEHQYNAAVLRSVAAGDGKVFLTIHTGIPRQQRLYAYDTATGNELWKREFNGFPGISVPAYSNGIVYAPVSGRDGPQSEWAALYGFDAMTGSQLFRSPVISQGTVYGVPAVFDGTVYGDTGFFGGIRAVDANSGAFHWDLPLPQQHGWSPAVDSNHVYVYMGSGPGSPGPRPGRLYAIDRLTGEVDYEIYDHSSNNYANSAQTPLLGDHGDAFATDGERLVRFDLNARRVSWDVDGAFRGKFALRDGQLFAINAGTLEARDQLTGDLIWSWAPEGVASLDFNVIATDSHVFVSSFANAETYAIDLQSHEEVWTFDRGGFLALTENWLFIKGVDFSDRSISRLSAVNLEVPEPTTFVLAISALVALSSVWRRYCHRCPY